jgi:hypothetical protein
MRVIWLIDDPAMIERILSWLGLWDPRPACGPSPPGERASLALVYHPVPDIACPAEAALAVLAICEFAKGAQYLP